MSFDHRTADQLQQGGQYSFSLGSLISFFVVEVILSTIIVFFRFRLMVVIAFALEGVFSFLSFFAFLPIFFAFFAPTISTFVLIFSSAFLKVVFHYLHSPQPAHSQTEEATLPSCLIHDVDQDVNPYNILFFIINILLERNKKKWDIKYRK